MDDEADGNIASVIFKLTADGTEIYNSGTMLKGMSKTIDISVKGVNELKLTVKGNSTTGGWPYDWGHADWAEAKLVKRYNAAETADITGFHNAVKRSVIKPGTTSAVEAVEIKPIEHSNVSTGTLKLKANQDYILEFEYWADVEGDIIITDLYPDSLPEAVLTAKKSVQKARLTINSGLPEMAYASLRFFVNNGYGRVNSGSVYIANVRLYAKEVDTNPFRYAGEYLDFETGYIYLRRRYYDPGIGRFINEDPIRTGRNYYVYCSNNPVNRIDPWGLADVAVRKWVDSHKGAAVSWNANTKVATVTYNGKSLNIKSTPQNNKNGSIVVSDTILNNALVTSTKSGAAGKSGTSSTASAPIAPSAVSSTGANSSTINNTTSVSNVVLSNSLPRTGEPNSTGRLYNPDGSIKQERNYGSDGQPIRDRDYSHGGEGHEFPHDHDWVDGERQPGVPVPKSEPKPAQSNISPQNISEAADWAAVGVIIYWIISEGSRILFPPRNFVPIP